MLNQVEIKYSQSCMKTMHVSLNFAQVISTYSNSAKNTTHHNKPECYHRTWEFEQLSSTCQVPIR